MVAPGTVGVGAVAVTATLTMALLALDGPRIDAGTVVGTLPWVVVAGLLHALGAFGAYPSGLSPVVQLPFGLLLTFVVASVLWLVSRQFAALRNVDVGTGRYVAAAGAGAATVLTLVLVLVTTPGPEALFWLAGVPIAAAVLAGVGVVSLGLFDPSALARMRWVALLVVFGFTLLGTTVAVGIDALGAATTSATAPVVALASSLPTAELSVAWPLVLLWGGVGIALVSVLARILATDRGTGLVLSAAFAAGTVAPSVALLGIAVLR